MACKLEYMHYALPNHSPFKYLTHRTDWASVEYRRAEIR
jgi:hypothetical protein